MDEWINQCAARQHTYAVRSGTLGPTSPWDVLALRAGLFVALGTMGGCNEVVLLSSKPLDTIVNETPENLRGVSFVMVVHGILGFLGCLGVPNLPAFCFGDAAARQWDIHALRGWTYTSSSPLSSLMGSSFEAAGILPFLNLLAIDVDPSDCDGFNMALLTRVGTGLPIIFGVCACALALGSNREVISTTGLDVCVGTVVLIVPLTGPTGEQFWGNAMG